MAAVEALRTGSLIIGHAPAGSSTPEGREEGLRMCVSARVGVCVCIQMGVYASQGCQECQRYPKVLHGFKNKILHYDDDNMT